MKTIGTLLLLITLINPSFTQNKKNMKTLHDFKTKTIDGKEYDFNKLKGKKVMIVNTASECGLTPQYIELEQVYKKYGGDNFIIIGFPANNFGAQEPGTDQQIAAFCKKNYGVTFPMMSKISVKGVNMDAIYEWLTKKEKNGVQDADVTWNFQKFLIDENGKLVKSIPPQTKPNDEEIIKWIKS